MLLQQTHKSGRATSNTVSACSCDAIGHLLHPFLICSLPLLARYELTPDSALDL
jgi:hypothetical protein